MGIQIIVMEDCASNYGIFKVEGSKGNMYTVMLNGSEGPASCTCEAFKWSGAEQNCKHIKLVSKKACLYNPQWHDSNENPEIRPVGFMYDRFTSSKCDCGGPMVAVRRAV